MEIILNCSLGSQEELLAHNFCDRNCKQNLIIYYSRGTLMMSHWPAATNGLNQKANSKRHRTYKSTLHSGGRARSSDEFVCLHWIPLKKYTFQMIAKEQVFKYTHTSLDWNLRWWRY